jgi:hypothetical protein
LLGSGFQRRMFSFLCVSEISPASATSFSHLITDSNSEHSSAPGLTSSQAGDHLTPTSYSSVISKLSRNGSYSSLYSPCTDRRENVSSIIACSLVSGETCPRSCFPATAVILSPVYTAVTWQCVYMSHHLLQQKMCRTEAVERNEAYNLRAKTLSASLAVFETTERT